MNTDVYNEDKSLGGAKGDMIHGQLGFHICYLETMGNEYQISTVSLSVHYSCVFWSSLLNGKHPQYAFSIP